MSAARILAAIFLLGLAAPGAFAQTKIRLGHFPNITHAQALVASQLSRQGRGWFEQRLGGDVKVEYYVYNAGPSAMEAIFTRSIDLTYVGPNPVLNAYSKSQGQEMRVVAGACNGGAALVVQPDGRLSKPEDFRGHRIATPQLGNTQDVACRAWLKKHGYRITQIGGDVSVVPASNPDQLALFQAGKIDGAWTVEPWVTRLEREAKGRIMIEQKDALTTVLATGVKFQREHPELLKKFVAAHVALTHWINENPAEAKELVRAELKELSRREFPAETTDGAWRRLTFTSEISRQPFEALVAEARSVGFLKGIPDLGKLVATP